MLIPLAAFLYALVTTLVAYTLARLAYKALVPKGTSTRQDREDFLSLVMFLTCPPINLGRYLGAGERPTVCIILSMSVVLTNFRRRLLGNRLRENIYHPQLF